MLCPICKTNKLTGRQQLCSDRCRQRRARAVRADRVERVRSILNQQSAVLTFGGDPAVAAALTREAQRLLESV